MPMSDIKMEGIGSLQSKTDISAMLSKIRAISNSTKAFGASTIAPTEHASSFQAIMSVAKDAIGSVSKAQEQTDMLKNAYISGDKNVSISEVMISSVKSKVAFEGLLAVRNKLIESYKEIMSMPI